MSNALSVKNGLARGRRRAWQLALALLGVSTALHLLHRFGPGAAVTGTLTVALVALRDRFDRPGDPAARPRILVRAAAFAAGIFAYGFAAMWLNRLAADQPFTLGFALRETSRALVGPTSAARLT